MASAASPTSHRVAWARRSLIGGGAGVVVSLIVTSAACVEGLGCSADAECPAGLVCRETCVLPASSPSADADEGVFSHLVVGAGVHDVAIGVALGAVVDVAAPVGVNVDIVDEDLGGTVIHVDSVVDVEADVVVRFVDGTAVEIAVRPRDWQDPTRRHRRALRLTGDVVASSAPGDLVWLSREGLGAADVAFFDPGGARLNVVSEDDEGVTLGRPRGDVIAVYSDVVPGADTVDSAVAVNAAACAFAAPGASTSVPGAGVIEALVKLNSDDSAEVELLTLNPSDDTAGLSIARRDDRVIVSVVEDDGGLRTSRELGGVSGVIGDDGWHGLALFYSPTGAALVVDERVSALETFPSFDDVVVASDPEVCALSFCGEGQGLSPSSRALLVASRNGDVVKPAPALVRQRAFENVAAVAGAVAADANVDDSSVVVAVRVADDSVDKDVAINVVGLGLEFTDPRCARVGELNTCSSAGADEFSRQPTGLGQTQIFVGHGRVNDQLPLVLRAGGEHDARSVVADVVVMQLRGASSVSVIDDVDDVDARNAGRVVVGAAAGALVVIVAEADGVLEASSPTVASEAGGLALLSTTALREQQRAELRFSDGVRAKVALAFLP